jgi:hypothetical protein
MVRLCVGCVGLTNSTTQVHLAIVHEAAKSDGSCLFSSAERLLMRCEPTDLGFGNDTGG